MFIYSYNFKDKSSQSNTEDLEGEIEAENTEKDDKNENDPLLAPPQLSDQDLEKSKSHLQNEIVEPDLEKFKNQMPAEEEKFPDSFIIKKFGQTKSWWTLPLFEEEKHTKEIIYISSANWWDETKITQNQKCLKASENSLKITLKETKKKGLLDIITWRDEVFNDLLNERRAKIFYCCLILRGIIFMWVSLLFKDHPKNIMIMFCGIQTIVVYKSWNENFYKERSLGYSNLVNQVWF